MTLARIDMFDRLSNLEVAKALGRMDKLDLPAGSLLFRQGDPGDSMYIIQRGKVRLSTETSEGGLQPLALLEEGDTFGEMALLTGETRSATASTTEDSVLFAMNKEAFDKLIAEQPAISAYFISLLSRRLVRTNDHLHASNEAKMKWIVEELERLPLAWQDMLVECSTFPRFDSDLLAELFGAEASQPMLKRLTDRSERLALERLENGAGYAISPSIRPTLLLLFSETRSEERKNELRSAAIGFWIRRGDWDEAIGIRAEDGEWGEALKLISEAQEWGERTLDALDRCPAELLHANYAVLDRYLAACAANKRESGIARLEDALDGNPSLFTTEQKRGLYERGADLCRALGSTAKSLEFMTMAEQWGVAPENEERAYRQAKQKQDRRRTGELASQAGHLLKSRRLSLALALLAAAASLVFFCFAPPWGELTRQGMVFVGIGIAAVALWVADAVADYLVALLMAMLWVVGGIVPPEVALSGFASTTWLYMLFILAFGAAISKSGILFRLSLHALKRFPANYRGQLWGIVAGGTLLNPLIPSSSAKAALGVPIARSLAESMGFRDRSRGAAGLGLAATVFYGFTAPFVLTGSYSNAMAFGLADGTKLPGWFQWFGYALPAFLVFSAVMLTLLFVVFRGETQPKPVSARMLDDQLQLLGKFSKQERLTAWTVLGSIALMILQPLHGLDNAWTMLLGFSVLVVTGTLDGRTLKTGVDWTFLLFIGIAFSFADAAKRLGIVDVLSDFLGERMGVFLSSPALFLVAAMAVSFIVTLVIRDDPALIVLVIALLPLAEQAGVHPWVLVFVVLLCTDPFFFAYQSPTYLTAYYSAEGKSFSHGQGRAVALGYGLAVAAAVMVSVPYWRWLGLIGP